MHHRIAGVRLSRTSAHRKALFSNLIAALFTHERIRTTDAKAKETRRLAERTITWARRVVRDRGAVVKLFDELAPRYFGRQGGYTRIVKLPQRPGDAAPMALLELMPEEGGAVAKPAGKGEKADKGAPAPGKDEKAGKGTKAQAKGAEKPAKKAPKK